MAHTNNSVLIKALRGMLGKELVFRNWGDKTIVSKAPKKGTKSSSAAQAATREKFHMAILYAKTVINNEDQSMALAYAAAAKPRQNVISKAISDFMSSPKVLSVDTKNYHGAAGNRLLVHATDDFRVVSVWVEIYAANGQLLEAGNAIQNASGIFWTYTATQANNLLKGTRIKATATDVPENTGTMETII